MKHYKPVALVILDGLGDAPPGPGNAVKTAHTPILDALRARYPSAQLRTDGVHVGLTPGQMGNSNVGHLNLGAGRVVVQDLVRIDRAFADGTLARSETLRSLAACERVHLLGLASPGGVHSHERHLLALMDLVPEKTTVDLHLFLDGRDVPPQSAGPSLQRFAEACQRRPHTRLASIGGRYYAMDRDQRWQRTEQAYRAIVQAEGPRAADWRTALETSYAHGVTDEFVAPTVLDGVPAGPSDVFVIVNFRTDRVRQLARALADPEFDAFARPSTFGLVTMTQVLEGLPAKVLVQPMDLSATFGECVAAAGLRQLRVAETEKYAHVTYFFNGGREEPFAGEDRILVPSPKVATYDLKPEMSAAEVTVRAMAALRSGQYDALILNFANTDMVGHTGVMQAAVAAVETVDSHLGELVGLLLEMGGAVLVLADHGNAETMVDLETGQPHTAHTLNPVPVILVAEGLAGLRLRDGILADCAPTLLELLGLPVPLQMTASSLILREDDSPDHHS